MEIPELEKILKEEHKPSLSATERASIKAALLDHAAKSLAHDAVKSPTPWFSWRSASALSFASIFLAFIGTGYASTSSLPGDPLYAMKVQVTEEAISYTKFDAMDQASYEITRLETRLSELKELSRNETITPAGLEAVSLHISEHISDAAKAVEQTSTTTYTHEDRITTLSKLGGIIQAHETLVEAEVELSPLTDAIDVANTVAEASLEDAVEQFAAEEQGDDLENYLSDQISEVSADIQSQALEPETQEEALTDLHDADDSLAEGNAGDALLSVLDAQQQIAAEEYLEE